MPGKGCWGQDTTQGLPLSVTAGQGLFAPAVPAVPPSSHLHQSPACNPPGCRGRAELGAEGLGARELGAEGLGAAPDHDVHVGYRFTRPAAGNGLE